jgi:hemerythrin superfamily protein
MTIFDVLKKDHDEVKDILDKIDKDIRGDGSQCEALFGRVKPMVLAHSRAEEEVFYSVLEEHDVTEDLAEHAEDEHAQIEELLEQMDEDEPGEASWRMAFEQMAGALRHHIQQEEGEMFRKAREVLSEQELLSMADAFTQRKQRVLTGGQDAQQRRSA